VILSQLLQSRAYHEIDSERLDLADALADEALHWATAASDDWEIAQASRAKAIAAPSIAELRERVDTAATLLADVGNLHDLAHLLTAAAYAALCLGNERDATDFAARATPITRAGQSLHADDQQWQSRPGRAVDRGNGHRFAGIPRGTHPLPRNGRATRGT
jgi:hypothetical protein